MKIEAIRAGGSGVLRLGGRLDREGAEHLSSSLEDLLRHGVRSLTVDFSEVTYISSAATKILTRWQQELAGLRGEITLASLSPAVRETLAIAGWDWRMETIDGAGTSGTSLRQSSWQLHAGSTKCGEYQDSTHVAEGALTCHLHGNAGQTTHVGAGANECDIVAFPKGAFGLGLGAIGGSGQECQGRLGELVAAEGCVAYFPSDGARMADYLVGDGAAAPRVGLASGVSCEGEFSKLVRFSARPEADTVPFSELAAVCLDAAGGKMAGLVIAGETAGLSAARLRRSPPAGGPAAEFEVPAIREWLSFASERTYPGTTALIAGVVARQPAGRLAAYLRPLAAVGQLYGHFHAAVFSYRPLPQRTVDLGDLVRGLFRNHQLRDVLHLLWDDRGENGVGESTLVRGVAWAGPISQIS